ASVQSIQLPFGGKKPMSKFITGQSRGTDLPSKGIDKSILTVTAPRFGEADRDLRCGPSNCACASSTLRAALSGRARRIPGPRSQPTLAAAICSHILGSRKSLLLLGISIDPHECAVRH